MATPVRKSIYGRQIGIDDVGRLTGVGRPFTVKMTAAVGAANQTIVTMTVVDNEDAACAGVYNFDVWLSDATTGAGLTATTASGAVATSGTGVDLAQYTAKKAIYVQTNASGIYTLGILDTAKTAFKVCALNPADGNAVVGVTLTTGNYG